MARLVEVPQVRRRLARAAWPELAVDPNVVGLSFDEDVVVVLGAAVLDPHSITRAIVAARHRPGPGQRIVVGGDLVTQDVRVGLVEEDALLDDGLIVLVQRDAARIEDARAFEMTGLHLEHVVAAVAILIDPFADRVAREGWLDIL